LAAVRKLSPRGKAFERIWRAVGEAVQACGFVLRGDLIRAAAAQTKPGRVWLDGFLAFSPLERELVAALARTSDMTLTLTDSAATDEMRRFAIQLGADDRLLSGATRKPCTVTVKAVSPEREADEIARRIIELHEKGRRFRDIGVALRDTDVYLPLLRGTFDRFGIPARFYFASPLRTHPAAIFLGGLIRCAMNGWEFATVLETLRAHPRWGHSAEMDRIDFALREAMPARGADAVMALCAGSRFEEDLKAWVRTEEWGRERARPVDWLARMERIAETFYRPGTLDAPRDYADVQTARSHMAAVRSWLVAMESATAIWPSADQAVSLEDFWVAAEEAVEGAAVDVPDLRADVVHVMNAYEARQWDVNALFVCGMSDREYPRGHVPNLLFPDSDLVALSRAGISLRSSLELDKEERWLFEALRSRATETLVLSYATHDTGGKSAEGSRFLPERDAEAAVARAAKPVARVLPASKGIPGRVSSAALLEAMTKAHQTVSLTALEDLAQCRFRFFSGRTLGLRGAPERPDKRLEARVTGLILHEALEHWQTDQSRDFVEVFEATFEEACRKHNLPPGYQLEVERIRFRDIASKVRTNERWTADSSDVEVDIKLSFLGGIVVTGRIDRLDRFGNDCIIVDYKSSKTENVEKLVGSSTKLQGPLYALAARESLGLNPLAVLYWAVRDNKLFGWGSVPNVDLSLKEMPENWAGAARDRAADRLAGYLAGAIHAQPEEADKCRWCEFQGACRVEQPAEMPTLVMIEGAGV
jgi:ATP-dependent helicase/DNAse subunit B